MVFTGNGFMVVVIEYDIYVHNEEFDIGFSWVFASE